MYQILHCDETVLYLASQVCIINNTDIHDKDFRFNLLHFAHALKPLIPYSGSHCSRMADGMQCWHTWAEMCGGAALAAEYNIYLFLEGCEIQQLLEEGSCYWQDILLPYYLEASHSTVWPLLPQYPSNPMSLDPNIPSNVTNVMSDFVRLIQILQQGVSRVKQICGNPLGNRLEGMFEQLKCMQRDAIKMLYD